MRTQTPTASRSRTVGAFTLIELLVVMAIIAVLMGLLFPSIAHVKESANIANCTSNMQQIWRALNTYTTDNQGRLPWNETGGPQGSWVTGYTPVGTNGVLGITRGTLYKYVKDVRVFKCPSYPDPEYVRAYSMADFMSGKSPSATLSYMGYSSPTAPSIGSVERPAQTMMLVEENPPGWPPADGRTYLNDGYFAGNTGRERTGTYHRPDKNNPSKGKSNVCFVDGHIQTVSAEEAGRAYEMFYRVVPINQ